MSTKETGSRDNWGSRIGYILSTLGMALGVGAMWRFPMLTAMYGGGAFVIAFVIVSILAVLPAGWAESALGRKYKKSPYGTMTAIAGKKGTAFSYIMAATPLGLMFYYPIIMGTLLIYIGATFMGAPFLADVEAFYNTVNNNRALIYASVAFVILLTSLINLRGIQKGVEACCKVLMPIMLVFLIIICIRVFTLPGIMKGINFYLEPDLSQLKRLDLWLTAGGMALFAVGLGPGFLMTYGSYASEKADLATDFVTINITQLLICVLCGFAIIPPVILFGLDPTAGKGLVFQSLPLIFSQLSGGMIWFVLFMVAFFFAGLSTTLSLVEVPAAFMMEAFNLSRKKAVGIVTCIALIGAVPCVWNDAFFMVVDNLVANIGYSLTAFGVAFYLAWVVGAEKIRTEWYNPTSVVKYGKWVDLLYKFVAVPAFLYFAVGAILSLFK